MSKIVWDAVGERKFETGVDHGVYYPQSDAGAYTGGVAWNGLTGITESPSGAEATALWADNIKYAELRSAEEYGATIEAYTYPPEFDQSNGIATLVAGVKVGQQTRRPFGFSYRTKIGNDVKGTEYGYKLHLVYGATASPSEKSHSTINDSPDGETMSWEISTVPVNFTLGGETKTTAHLEIDSTTVDATKLAAFEAILYGSEETDARMPLPNEVATLLKSDG